MPLININIITTEYRQLQSAGRDEEERCRFCRSTLPRWSGALLDDDGMDQEDLVNSCKESAPIMAVSAACSSACHTFCACYFVSIRSVGR
jgi:hypothetical protein